jgi:hypothetical protein
MAIRTVVTRGYGNGTFNGTIKDVTLRGYSIGVALTLAVYTASVFANPTPTRNLESNISPTRNLNSNPTPTREVEHG